MSLDTYEMLFRGKTWDRVKARRDDQSWFLNQIFQIQSAVKRLLIPDNSKENSGYFSYLCITLGLTSPMKHSILIVVR